MKTKTKAKQDEVLNILCLEDSPKDAEIIHESLIDAGFKINVDCTDKEKEFVSFLRNKKYDLILSDFKLPGFDGFKALKWSVEICPDVPFICISGTVGEEIAVELLKKGAVDYVLKGRLEKLPIVIKRALDEVKEKKARELAEKAIIKERTLLRTLIDNLPMGVFVKDREYKKIIVNPVHLNEVKGHLKHLGKNSETDILGKTDFEVFPNELAKNFFTEDQKVIQDGSLILNNEGIGYSEEGNQLCLLVSKIPLRDNNGEIVGMVGLANDITERKRAEEAMEESEEKFSVAFKTSPYAIAITHFENGRIIEVNDAFYRITGFTPEETRNNATVIMDLWVDGEDRNRMLRKLLSDGKAEGMELKLKKKNGEIMTGLFSARIIHLKGEQFILSSINDITDRKRMEDALQVSKDFLDRIINSVASPIFVKDHKHKFYLVNKALCSLLNLPVEKLIGITGYEYFPKEQMEIFIAKDEEVFITGNENINEEFLTDGQGKVRTIITRKTLYTDMEGNKFLVGIINDITERKIAEEKLQFNNAILTTQQEASIDGILVINEKGEIISYNQRFVKMWDIPIDALESKSDERALQSVIEKLVNPEEFITRVKYLYDHHDETSREEVALKDGRTFDRYSAPMFGAGSKYYGRVWYFRDITERKRGEESLRSLSTRNEAILDSVPDIIMEVDNNKIYTWANRAGIEFFGGEVIGKEAVYYFEGEQETYDIVQPLFDGNENIIYVESWQRRSDGEKRLLAWWCRRLIDNDGNTTGLLSAAQDITNRKLAEEALLKEQYLTDTFMENAPDRIYFKDRESRYIRISKAQARLFGLSDPEQAIGKSDSDFFTKEHANMAYDDEQEIIRTGQPISKEEKETWPGRPDTWVYSTKLPLRDKEGTIIGTFGISMDITARKEVELLLIQKNQEIELQNEEFLTLNDELSEANTELILAKEKAEENDHLKTAFLQNMSHEIRTPMNGILGFAELLKNHKLPDFKQQEFIHLIEQSGERMLNIINDIVNISKIETGQIELFLQETNVNQLLSQLNNFFKIEAERKELGLAYKTGLSDELSIVETDDKKLTQVLSNLLKNALKFTKSGSVEFGYKIVETMHATSLQFYVQDTGIGIAPDQHSIIFERFRQVDMSIARNYEGAGLGLAISKAFVEKLGGKIWVESELGNGAAFFFNIPYNPLKTTRAESAKEAETSGSLHRINILIAEDDDISAIFLKELLENEKANLFFATNGQEAVDIVKTNPEIQIVLMDLKMPVMNGFEATRLIKKIYPALPVIAQSAYAFSNDRDKAKLAGCDDFIGKPLKQELLLFLIKKHLEKSKLNKSTKS